MSDNIINRDDDELAFLESMTNHIKNEYELDDDDRSQLLDFLTEIYRSDKREAKSRLTNLIVNMLKLKYQPQRTSWSWISTITIQSFELRNIVFFSPSMKRVLEDDFEEIYMQAVKNASIETRLSKNSFPSECEFTVDELLNVDFIDHFIDEYASKSTNTYFDYTK